MLQSNNSGEARPQVMNEVDDAPWFQAHWADMADVPGKRSADLTGPITSLSTGLQRERRDAA